MAKTWHEDPSLCPTSGKQMKILAAISSPAQDDVIEKILRARGEWNPPWLTARQARGPPASEGVHPTTEAHWLDPPPPDNGYLEDPSVEE